MPTLRTCWSTLRTSGFPACSRSTIFLIIKFDDQNLSVIWREANSFQFFALATAASDWLRWMGYSQAAAQQFAPGKNHLERYAQFFNACEINSSFYRPHKIET